MFWLEAILTTTYILNRLPSAILKRKTPYEILYNKAPDYTYLKVFGTLCFSNNNLPSKGKFGTRGIKCVFLSYAQGHKGYKLYDLNKHTIKISRNVTFYEDIFPYAGQQQHPITCPIPVAAEDQDECLSKTPTIIESDSETLGDPNMANTQTTPTFRQSSRTHDRPTWMQDFQCDFLAADRTLPVITAYNPAHACFLASLTNVQESRSFLQAQSTNDGRKPCKHRVRILGEKPDMVSRDARALGTLDAHSAAQPLNPADRLRRQTLGFRSLRVLGVGLLSCTCCKDIIYFPSS
ncbi:UNVERIFIED_CONTAM: Copia protein [Sesamum radiatum]|uniref:Copia protein n=1 Tax=Sesamum radiatum TaxID=300843 RepID=A0AAW2JIE6_SESRA